MIDFLKNIDSEILLFFNSMHNSFSDTFMLIATGKLIWIPFYVALIYHIFYRYGWRRGVTWVVMIALAVAMADQICATVIRPLVGRLRPSNILNPISEFVHIVNGYRGGQFGFPSCHGANTFAMACLVWLVIPRKSVRISVAFWVLINIYSRIYLGVHYPGDILAGAVIGIASASLFYYAGKKIIAYFHLNAVKERPSSMLLPVKAFDVNGSIYSEVLSGVLTMAQLVLLMTLATIAIYAI